MNKWIYNIYPFTSLHLIHIYHPYILLFLSYRYIRYILWLLLLLLCILVYLMTRTGHWWKKEERENGTTREVCASQFTPCVVQYYHQTMTGCGQPLRTVYKPVWEIDTHRIDRDPRNEWHKETHPNIRDWLRDTVSPDVAPATRISYGGSRKGVCQCDRVTRTTW